MMISDELPEVGKNDIKYSNVCFDQIGRCSTKDYMPLSCDLVQMFHENGFYNGWWTGSRWMGLRYKKEHKITHWKRLI